MIPRVLPNAANRGVEQNLNEHANTQIVTRKEISTDRNALHLTFNCWRGKSCPLKTNNLRTGPR
jgi:hypothetical protein